MHTKQSPDFMWVGIQKIVSRNSFFPVSIVSHFQYLVWLADGMRTSCDPNAKWMKTVKNQLMEVILGDAARHGLEAYSGGKHSSNGCLGLR